MLHTLKLFFVLVCEEVTERGREEGIVKRLVREISRTSKRAHTKFAVGRGDA